MTSQTNEQALEAAIEKALTGSCIEELTQQNSSLDGAQDPQAQYRTGNGFYRGNPADFDAKYALDKERFWNFLSSTQPQELAKLQKQHNWQLKLVERLHRSIKKKGLLEVLRNGLEIDDASFTFLYSLPTASSGTTVQQQFESNQFSVTRQVRYSIERPMDSIDMVIFVNGLPIITMELKNIWTGQNARHHGQKQYKEQRDPKQTLLHFGRCLVHFAVDPDEVYMTTKLAGQKTFFLPFNKGHNHGQGNPTNPNGHKTAYLWQTVFKRKSLTNLLQHFVRFGGKKMQNSSKKRCFFRAFIKWMWCLKSLNTCVIMGLDTPISFSTRQGLASPILSLGRPTN